MKNITAISNARGDSAFRPARRVLARIRAGGESGFKAAVFSWRNFIELTHRDSDPGTWIVTRWRRFLWFKKRISSRWFNDEHQAIVFAREMKLRHVGESVRYLYNRKERSLHGAD